MLVGLRRAGKPEQSDCDDGRAISCRLPRALPQNATLHLMPLIADEQTILVTGWLPAHDQEPQRLSTCAAGGSSTVLPAVAGPTRPAAASCDAATVRFRRQGPGRRPSE